MCGHTRRDKIKNEDIENKIEMTLIEKKMWQTRLG